MMDIRPIDDHFSVSPQINPEDLPALARSGYRVLICNRPDGEEPGQPDSAAMREAAADAGLTFHYIPVSGGAFPAEAIAAFRDVRTAQEAKMIAYCRTGTRSITLETLSNPVDRGVEERLQLAKRAGYDLTPLAARLDK